MAERPNVIEQAVNICTGDRVRERGNPADTYAPVARLWSAYLGIELTPADVCQLMVLLKVGRESHRHEDDNLVDQAGFAWCTDECLKRSEGEAVDAITLGFGPEDFHKSRKFAYARAGIHPSRACPERPFSGLRENKANGMVEEREEANTVMAAKLAEMAAERFKAFRTNKESSMRIRTPQDGVYEFDWVSRKWFKVREKSKDTEQDSLNRTYGSEERQENKTAKTAEERVSCEGDDPKTTALFREVRDLAKLVATLAASVKGAPEPTSATRVPNEGQGSESTPNPHQARDSFLPPPGTKPGDWVTRDLVAEMKTRTNPLYEHFVSGTAPDEHVKASLAFRMGQDEERKKFTDEVREQIKVDVKNELVRETQREREATTNHYHEKTREHTQKIIDIVRKLEQAERTAFDFRIRIDQTLANLIASSQKQTARRKSSKPKSKKSR